MQYRVLGPLQVDDEGRILDLGRPKQRALLAVLLVDAGRVVTLDRLIDLLWGEERPARSTASLQVYVSNLRRILEPGRLPRTTSAVLVTHPPGYMLRIGPDDLDALLFEALAARGRRLLAEGRYRPARQTLGDALALWRGDALADFADHDFAQPSIVRWEQLRQVAEEDRIEADLALGAHDRSVAELEGLLACFPHRERLWGLLMVALYRGGRQGDALKAVARARAVLIEDLGLQASPDLARLEADILAHAPTLMWRRDAGSEGDAGGEGLPAIVVEPAGTPANGPGALLVGRTGELAALEQALDDAVAGRGRMVLVSGEAGIGKTRLAEELATRASAAGAAVAWGGAPEGESAPAFWPWVQVLRTILTQAGPGTLPTGMLEKGLPGAPWLAQLVPDAAALLGSPGPPPALDAESARFQLYEAVVGILASAAANRPLVVVLDDLHWADVASLALCGFVAARLRDTRLLVVATYRPAELTRDHPLVPTLADLARQPRLGRIELGGLDRKEVGDFLAGGWGIAPSGELAAAVHARTEGNPFFVSELVKLLASEGRLGWADAVAVAHVPAGVRDVLRRRLGRLPEATNALLRVAAVIGREFDLEVLSGASDHDEERTLEGVEAALVTGIVADDQVVLGRYRFSHALGQEALYAELSAVRRARLHARVGATLESLPRSPARVAELARHFYRAAGVVGPEKGVGYALDAADAAQAALAYETAEEHLRRALELVQTMPAGADRDSRELRIQNRLALSLMMNGGMVSRVATQAYDRAAELGVALGDTRELLSSMSGLTKAATVRAEWHVVSTLGTRMVRLAETSGDQLGLAAGLFALGNANMFRGELSQAKQLIDDAIAISRPLWEPAGDVSSVWVSPLVYALAVRGLILSLDDDEASAARFTADAIAVAEAAGFPFWAAGVHLCDALRSACTLDTARAVAASQRCLAVGRAAGMGGFLTLTEVLEIWGGGRESPGPDHVRQLQGAILACEAAGITMWRPLRRALLADALLRAGQPAEAVRAADQGLAACLERGERVCEAELHRLRGEALAAIGPHHTADAEASLRRAVAVAEAQGANLFVRRAAASLDQLVGYDPGLTATTPG